MTKEWGIKNKLNPVIYLEKGSLITKDIQDTMDNMINLLNAVTIVLEKVPDLIPKLEETNDQKEILNKIKDIEILLSHIENYPELINHSKKTAISNMNITRYIKNYQGSLTRGGKTIKNYRFYDEREWRYVPAINDKRAERWLNEELYIKYRGNGIYKPLIDKITLNFTSEDIKYLVVKSSKDIPKLIKLVKSLNNLTKNPYDADLLTTKILTIEQLNNDF